MAVATHAIMDSGGSVGGEGRAKEAQQTRTAENVRDSAVFKRPVVIIPFSPDKDRTEQEQEKDHKEERRKTEDTVVVLINCLIKPSHRNFS
jgi:hypothetical protein